MSSSSRATSHARRHLGLREPEHPHRHDVLAVVQPGHGHRQHDHGGPGGGDLDRLGRCHRREGELGDVGHETVGRAEGELLPAEVGERDLVVRRDDVVARHHDDRDLLVQRDAVQSLAVDGSARQHHVHLAGAEGRLGGFGLEGDQLQGIAGVPLPPGPGPLVGEHPGDEADAQRRRPRWGRRRHATKVATSVPRR